MIPKFRAFIKANTETIYGGLVYSDDCVLPVGLIDFTDGEVTVWGCGREDCGLCGDDFRLDDIVLMQYTGLKDKNGVEIFEGDEIELTHSDLEGETIYSKAIAKAPMDYTLEEAVALNYAHEIELTGKNIYENTELLEVAE